MVVPEDCPIEAFSPILAIVSPSKVTTTIEAPAEVPPTATFGVSASISKSDSAFTFSAAPCLMWVIFTPSLLTSAVTSLSSTMTATAAPIAAPPPVPTNDIKSNFANSWASRLTAPEVSTVPALISAPVPINAVIGVSLLTTPTPIPTPTAPAPIPPTWDSNSKYSRASISTWRPAVIVAFSATKALVPLGNGRWIVSTSSFTLDAMALLGTACLTFVSTVFAVEFTFSVLSSPSSLLGSVKASNMVAFEVTLASSASVLVDIELSFLPVSALSEEPSDE